MLFKVAGLVDITKCLPISVSEAIMTATRRESSRHSLIANKCHWLLCLLQQNMNSVLLFASILRCPWDRSGDKLGADKNIKANFVTY